MIPTLAGKTTCNCILTMRRACCSGSGRKVNSPFIHRESRTFIERIPQLPGECDAHSSEQFHRALRYFIDRPQSADSLVTARKHTLLRADEFHAPAFECRHVLLRGGV